MPTMEGQGEAEVGQREVDGLTQVREERKASCQLNRLDWNQGFLGEEGWRRRCERVRFGLEKKNWGRESNREGGRIWDSALGDCSLNLLNST